MMAFYKDVVKPAELRRRLGAHTGGDGDGGGEQEAFAKCMETCPDLMKVLGVLMKEGAAMADPEVAKSPTKMRKAVDDLCGAMEPEHKDALSCAATKCEGMGQIAGLTCLCDCPDMVAMMGMEQDPEGALTAMCPKISELLACTKGDSCKAIPDLEAGQGLVIGACAMKEAGCAVSGAGSMEKCGEGFDDAKCHGEAMSGKPSEDCCTGVGKIMECMKKDCFLMAMGMAMSMDTAGNTEKIVKGYADGCANMDGISVDDFKAAGKKAMTPPKAAVEESAAGGATTCSAKAAAALTTLVAAKVLA